MITPCEQKGTAEMLTIKRAYIFAGTYVPEAIVLGIIILLFLSIRGGSVLQ